MKPFVPMLMVLLLVGVSIFPNISGNRENKIVQMEPLWGPPEELWNKTYGGSNSTEFAFSVQVSSDNGYIMTGGKMFPDKDYDLLMIKTDVNGNEEWNKTFSGKNHDMGLSVLETSDGGYIVAGEKDTYENSTLWLIKTNKSGIEEWNRTFDEFYKSDGNSIRHTFDGGYIITGGVYTYHPYHRQVLLLKIDENGNIEWNKTHGGFDRDTGSCIQQTQDGGYIIVGSTDSYGAGSADIWLIKTDSYGNEEWNRTYGGPEDDYSSFVQKTNDNGYIIAGITFSFSVHFFDAWLIKTDSQGIMEWNKTYGGPYDDFTNEVLQISDNKYLVVGSTYPDIYPSSNAWLIGIDENGNEEWNVTIGGPEEDMAHSIRKTHDYGYIISGSTRSYGSGMSDVWLIKLKYENQPPTVNIINPKEGYFHLSGISLIPTPLNLIADTISLGGFRLNPIIINATDDFDESEDLIVDIYLDGEYQGNASYCCDWRKHEWFWTGWAFGNYILKITAEDSQGEIGSEEIKVFNFCFLP